ncbi:hypothetical protein Fmac_008235 [Flemingia macrophylla]|uniref:IBH1-like N-terminal domain-containing protein n=1 Tax=Flemingia macrophylla TaxID=520843 RepID=A0ABD1MZ78_9FABA
MEGQPAKRRRVYSLEPNRVEQAVFARNYMNYLVPALMKIKERSSSQHSGHCDDIQNVVKYEVGMAMVYSAQGYAWSNALSVKLQRDRDNVGSDIKAGEGSSKLCGQNFDDEMVALDHHFPSNPSSKSSNKYKDMQEMKRGLREENSEEDEVVNGQMKSLRRLIPGGEEMCSEQMVTELQSYVSCLQMQVNILQCLAETHR